MLELEPREVKLLVQAMDLRLEITCHIAMDLRLETGAH